MLRRSRSSLPALYSSACRRLQVPLPNTRMCTACTPPPPPLTTTTFTTTSYCKAYTSPCAHCECLVRPLKISISRHHRHRFLPAWPGVTNTIFVSLAVSVRVRHDKGAKVMLTGLVSSSTPATSGASSSGISHSARTHTYTNTHTHTAFTLGKHSLPVYHTDRGL